MPRPLPRPGNALFSRGLSPLLSGLIAWGGLAGVAGFAVGAAPAQAAAPNDVYWSSQWWLQPVDPANPAAAGLDPLLAAQPANAQPANALPVVAVLDSGITAHPDLDSARLLPGYDFVSETVYSGDGDGRDASPADPGDALSARQIAANPADFGGCEIQDSSWHGTSVAGVLAASSSNAMGVAAATPLVRVLPLRVSGLCGASTQDVIDAMRWAAGIAGVCRTYRNIYDPAQGCASLMPANPTPARLINFSLGHGQVCDSSYSAVISELRQRGVLVVSSAGNSSTGVERPANCPGVLAVGALNRLGMKAWYGNFGPEVALSTPGGDVSGEPWDDTGFFGLTNTGSTRPLGGAYTALQGTSFAAPVVAAAAANMLQANPGLTPDQITAGLKASARPHTVVDGWPACSPTASEGCNCTTDTCGAGQLDAAEALRWATLSASGQPYTAPVRSGLHLTAFELGGRPPTTTPGLSSETGSGAVSSGGGATGWPLLLAGLLAALAAFRLVGGQRQPRRWRTD